MIAPELQSIQAKLHRQQPLTREEQTAWAAHLASSGDENAQAPDQQAQAAPGQSTYRTPVFGESENAATVDRQNMFRAPGARVGTTGGLLPFQGDAAPAAPPAVTPFEAGVRDGASADAYYKGLTSGGRSTVPGAAPVAGKPAAAGPKAPPPEAHSQIGARDPKARKPKDGQGTITRHHRDEHTGEKTGTSEVYGYDQGKAVMGDDGQKRDFGTTTAAMDHLDASFRAPTPAVAPVAPAPMPMLGQPTTPPPGTLSLTPPAPGVVPMPMGGAGGNWGQPTPAAPMPMQPPATTAPSVAAARQNWDMASGRGGLAGGIPLPQAQPAMTMPSAEAVAAAPAAAPRPADPMGFPAVPDPLTSPAGTFPGAPVAPIAGMGDQKSGEYARQEEDAKQRNQASKGFFSGPGTPISGPNPNRVSAPTGPMFPNAIWNQPMANAAELAGRKTKPFQATADQFNPFRPKILPE